MWLSAKAYHRWNQKESEMLIFRKTGHITSGSGDLVPLGMKSVLLDICDIFILHFFLKEVYRLMLFLFRIAVHPV